MSKPKTAPKKVVLAYSGGLDTSIILKWLQTEFGAEVVTFTADLGQGEELEPARKKALAAGVKPENIFIEDVREDFVRDYVFPMFRANAVYEGVYLLGTSIARPLIAKRQIEIADMVGADAVCHGATGKGNDQVRFELGYYGLNPDIKVIAPWRDWDFKSRTDLLKFAEEHGIEIAKTSAARPFGRREPAPLLLLKAKCWKTRPRRRRNSSICARFPRKRPRTSRRSSPSASSAATLSPSMARR
ncbi:MAG: argininosuccinate synthase [Hyphomonas sp.]